MSEAGSPSYERARFADRFVAFSLDLLAVIALSLAVCAALGAAHAVPSNFNVFWIALFFALFVGYNAFFNAGGRRTFGKWAVGLQVFTQDGYPVPLPQAFGRACGYLLSNVFCIGYLWALFQPQKLALHDVLAGTMVLETRPKDALGRAGVAVGCVVFGVLYAATALWPAAAPFYYDTQRVADAKETVLGLSTFEENYKKANGAYTGDVNALARFYGDPDRFFGLLSKTMHLDSLSITTDGPSYQIRAQALDSRHTPLLYKGPPKTP